MKKVTLLTALLAMMFVAVPAQAGVKREYTRTYYAVQGGCGKKAAGKNIRRQGVPPDGRTATKRHYRAATKRLKRKWMTCRPWAGPVGASWYGPGLYGNSFACGGRLHPGSRGVAHKTLPCGTVVTLRYNGRVVTTRVVDRGPYVAGRAFDLTPGTKADLGFGSTGAIHYRTG